MINIYRILCSYTEYEEDVMEGTERDTNIML